MFGGVAATWRLLGEIHAQPRRRGVPGSGESILREPRVFTLVRTVLSCNAVSRVNVMLMCRRSGLSGASAGGWKRRTKVDSFAGFTSVQSAVTRRGTGGRACVLSWRLRCCNNRTEYHVHEGLWNVWGAVEKG